MRVEDLAEALTAHSRLEPPSEAVLEGDVDLAIVDALIVGVATSVVEHGGRVSTEALTTLTECVLELQLAVMASATCPHPYVTSLMGLARSTEEWFVEGLR